MAYAEGKRQWEAKIKVGNARVTAGKKVRRQLEAAPQKQRRLMSWWKSL
jgi:hypothetical protein